jgi:hypothetical protein
MDASTWTEHFAKVLGVEAPTEEEIAALLSLASVAAHASERPAAPIACWLAAKAGRAPSEALSLARAMVPEE